MASFIVDNNVESTVADSPLAQSATTLNVATGEGANFPSTFPFRLTIWDDDTHQDPTDDSGMEIVECTARSTDALTIARGKEGTGDVAHANGERVALLITAGLFNDATYGITTKLDGIEAGATADQTGGEIKTLYEAEANAFTDTKNTKLAGIEDSATADQTDAEILVPVSNYYDIVNPDVKWYTNTAGAWIKIKETVLTNLLGFTTLKITFTHYSSHNIATRARVYRNGAAVGTEWYTESPHTTLRTRTQSIAGWSNNDLLQIYVYTPNTAGLAVYARDVKVAGVYEYTNQDP